MKSLKKWKNVINLLLYIAWALLFAICAGTGFIEPINDGQKVALMILALVFFVPPACLAARAYRRRDRKTFRILTWISAGSLVATMAAYIANIASVYGSQLLGDVLYGVLIVVSAPMVSMGVELLSLFLWACLLVFSFQNRK